MTGWDQVQDPIGNGLTTYGFVGGPMAFDIAAIQYLYGANMSYHTGADTYTLPDVNAPGTYWTSIWDADGIDQIVYGGTRNVTIDLRAATIDNSPTGGGIPSYADEIYGGFTIARNVVIENASGGSGNDTITGNNVANFLSGNDGADAIVGAFGNDSLVGAFGADTLLGNQDNDVLLGNQDNDIVVGGQGSDTVVGGQGFDFVFGNEANDFVSATRPTTRSLPDRAQTPSLRVKGTTVSLEAKATTPCSATRARTASLLRPAPEPTSSGTSTVRRGTVFGCKDKAIRSAAQATAMSSYY